MGQLRKHPKCLTKGLALSGSQQKSFPFIFSIVLGVDARETLGDWMLSPWQRSPVMKKQLKVRVLYFQGREEGRVRTVGVMPGWAGRGARQ